MANPNPNEITRFKPGESGNPNGRPKGQSLADHLREVAEETTLCGSELPEGRTASRALAEAMFMHAIKGNATYGAMIWDRLMGKAPPTIEDATTQDTATDDVAEAMIAAGLKAKGVTGGPDS